MDRDQPFPVPTSWLEALERSEADLEAGRTVAGEVVMNRLRQTIVEMEADAEGAAGPDEAAVHR